MYYGYKVWYDNQYESKEQTDEGLVYATSMGEAIEEVKSSYDGSCTPVLKIMIIDTSLDTRAVSREDIELAFSEIVYK